MQKMVETKKYTHQDIQNLVQNLALKNVITQKEAESINTKQLLEYTKSNLWKELSMAKEINKEKPFYINIPAKEVLKINTDDVILVQGIIDLYYINQNNELILVDYKTDYITYGEEKSLILKYRKQLELYKRALEMSLKRDVTNTYIYSTVLNKLIEIA